MSELSERLRKAKALIDAPEKWTKGDFAEDASGRSVHWRWHEAVRFCAEGAILRAGDGWGSAPEIFAVVEEFAGNRDLAQANDDEATTHADVMRWFDAAIAKEEAANG